LRWVGGGDKVLRVPGAVAVIGGDWECEWRRSFGSFYGQSLMQSTDGSLDKARS
jgi:hypothetical protein